jgi:DNA mismatch repair ATPase MutS
VIITLPEIVDGRHPMVEALRVDPFVPNSVVLGDGEPRSKIITGPNMGGNLKSSTVRMIAHAQILSCLGALGVKIRRTTERCRKLTESRMTE